MKQEQILDELIGLLEAHNVIIRREPMGGSGGGLCTVRGEKILFLDAQAQTAELASVCAEAVMQTIDIEQIYIRPEVRRFIENHRGQTA